MDILINGTQFARVLLALASLRLLYLPLGAAIPTSHELVKRANVNCVPKPPGTDLIIGDCLNAIFNMIFDKTPAERNRFQYFGSSMGADVQFETLLWDAGTVD